MNAKLEEKLAEYEKTAPIVSDEQLIDAIRFIIEEEEKQPVGERDLDLIDQAVEAILVLQQTDIAKLDQDAAAASEALMQSFHASATRRAHGIRVNRLLPIAAVFCAILAGAICAPFFMSAPPNAPEPPTEKISDTQGGGKDDAPGTEAIYYDVLYSQTVPDGYRIDGVTVSEIGESDDITLSITSDSEQQIEMGIRTNPKEVLKGVSDIEVERLKHIILGGEVYYAAWGGFDVCIARSDDGYRAWWWDEYATYRVKCKSEEDIKTLIEHLGDAE